MLKVMQDSRSAFVRNVFCLHTGLLISHCFLSCTASSGTRGAPARRGRDKRGAVSASGGFARGTGKFGRLDLCIYCFKFLLKFLQLRLIILLCIEELNKVCASVAVFRVLCEHASCALGWCMVIL